MLGQNIDDRTLLGNRTDGEAVRGDTASDADHAAHAAFQVRRFAQIVNGGITPVAAVPVLGNDPKSLAAMFSELADVVGVHTIVDRMIDPGLDALDGAELDAWQEAATVWLREVTARSDPRLTRMAIVVAAPNEPTSLSAIAAAAVLRSAGWDVTEAPPGALRQAAMRVRPGDGVLVFAADTAHGALEGESRVLDVAHRAPVVTVGRGFTQVESERLLPGPGCWEELPWEAERSLAYWGLD